MSKAEQTYRARELLRRWISGELNAAEERELERMAAADPMLAEALSGLRQMPEGEHERHLQQLERRLRQSERRKTAPVWRVAAAAVLLLGLGLVLWQITPGDRAETTLAQEQAGRVYEPKPEAQPAPERLQDNVPAPPLSSPTPAAPPRQKQPPAATAPPEQPAPRQVEPPVEEAEAAQEPLMADRPPATPTVREEQAYSKMDQMAKEVPAESRSGNSDTAPQMAMSRRTLPPTQEEAARYEQEEGLMLREAVDSPPAPYGGFPEYEQFLQKNIDRSVLPADSSLTEIELRFQIGPEGQPARLQFTDSLPPELRQEVERLFLNGPRWFPPGEQAFYRFRLSPR